MTRRIALAAALVLTLGALPLVAQGPGGAFGRAGQRMGGPGRGPGGPMGLLPGLDRVNLTDTQREQIRGILEEERQSGDDPAGKMREAEHALVSGVLAGDAAGIEAGTAAVNAAQTAGLERRVELMQKVAQVLTAEQRQQLAELPPPPGPRGRGRGDR